MVAVIGGSIVDDAAGARVPLTNALLDDAVAALGEEVYSLRLPDPALAAFYPRLDKAK